MTSVTHGIATAFATSPTADTCWNSSRPSGARASVTVHCSRHIRASRAFTPMTPASGPAAPVANNTPTATKLSQKPGCISAHGSRATTSAQVQSQTKGQGQRRPARRSGATAASIHTVRCEGRPQPLKSA